MAKGKMTESPTITAPSLSSEKWMSVWGISLAPAISCFPMDQQRHQMPGKDDRREMTRLNFEKLLNTLSLSSESSTDCEPRNVPACFFLRTDGCERNEGFRTYWDVPAWSPLKEQP
ncbi:hypothetical protein LEMLEM_LOCUS2847 [Lemmus lemmus]